MGSRYWTEGRSRRVCRQCLEQVLRLITPVLPSTYKRACPKRLDDSLSFSLSLSQLTKASDRVNYSR